MNEATVNKTMFDNVEAVSNLNRVEGFNPRDYMREIQGEGEAKKFYLDVAFRKLWFRLKYPEGKISKRLLKLADDMAVIEARVYLNYMDAEDNFVANAFSHKFRAADAQFGSKFVEFAETAATGRALADAGFGLQFADCEKETDPEVADAPFESRFLNGTAAGVETQADLTGAMEDAGTVIDENNLPGQHQIEEYIPMPGDVAEYVEQTTPAMQQNAGAGVKNGTPMTAQPSGNVAAPVPMQPAAAKPYAAPAQTQGMAATPQQSLAQIDRKLPAEQIYTMLTRETAAAVVVNVGYSKGKTLGQIAVEKPGSLEWYVNQYNGPDNLLRAAAKFLLDTALQKAS